MSETKEYKGVSYSQVNDHLWEVTIEGRVIQSHSERGIKKAISHRTKHASTEVEQPQAN